MFLFLVLFFIILCFTFCFLFFRILEIEKDINILYDNYSKELTKVIKININKNEEL